MGWQFWCVCLGYLHYAPENPGDGEMYLLVPAHPSCPGQSSESCKMVACVRVRACVNRQTPLKHGPELPAEGSGWLWGLSRDYFVHSLWRVMRSRRLLYAECDEGTSLVRACNLSAADCAVVLTRTHCITDLRFDTDVNTLFWIEVNMVLSLRVVAGTHPEFLKSVFLLP